MSGPNDNLGIDISDDVDTEVTMTQDRDELFALVELEKLRKRARRSVRNLASASPVEEPW